MNKTQLIKETRKLLGDIPTSRLPDATIMENINLAEQKFNAIAIMASGVWEVNGNVATTNLVAGQTEYVLTTNTPLLTLLSIEINRDGSVDGWVKLDTNDIRTQNYALSNSGSNYSEYELDLFNNSIILSNPPSVDVTGGLKIRFQQEAQQIQDNVYYATLEEAPTKTIYIDGLRVNLTIQLIQNTTDDLVSTLVGDLLTIKLANTTASKNTAALIQASVRLLFPTATVTGTNWTSILGSTITVGSVVTLAIIKDTSFLPEFLQMGLCNESAYAYALGQNLSEKIPNLEKWISIWEGKVESFYANRVKIQKTFKRTMKTSFR